MTIVVSVGGSVFDPAGGEDRIAGYASVFRSLHADDHEPAAVIGGGPTAREYIDDARDLGANEIELDNLGIAVTRLNARLLIAALGELSTPNPPTDLDQAKTALRRGDLPVMGGTAPAHTTDAVAASLAEYVDAERLVLATSVDGVYDADPSIDSSATKFDRISVERLIELVTEIDMAAGSNAPVDILAAKVIQRAGLPTSVVDGSDPEAIRRAVRGDHEGTDIVPSEG